MSEPVQNNPNILPDDAVLIKRRKHRMLVDKFARYGVGIGGISVIVAITLIFFYLAAVVAPLFKPAHIEEAKQYSIPGGTDRQTLMIATEEQAEVAIRLLDNGEVVFFDLRTGDEINRELLDLPPGAEITAFAQADPASRIFALGLSNGAVLVLQHAYDISYPDNTRFISPKITYPLGEDAIDIDPDAMPIKNIALQNSESGLSIVAANIDDRIMLSGFETEESLMDDEIVYERVDSILPSHNSQTDYLLIDKEQRVVYAADKSGLLHVFDINDKEEPILVENVRLLESANRLITDLRFLSGTISLIVADDKGTIQQWFPVRNEHNEYNLQFIRKFETNGKNLKLTPEYFRKAFITSDDSGQIGLFHATAQRTVLLEQLLSQPAQYVALSPRSNFLIAETADGQLRTWAIENEHPEISFHSLWQEVWYEGYTEPDYTWQSSAANNDFEPKFSLTPLSFGTIKAAFYAMLLAVPLAILGAIYTAYFMAPKLRQSIKPTIEIMEALPTVILGFLAGLWLAPFLETHLPGVFSLVIVMPICVIAFAFAWSRLPEAIRELVPDGWQPLLLLPIIILISWFALGISPYLEAALFGGDLPLWMRQELGVSFDQRNAVVVGLAMGFAVIPTIFSIAEDAIFSVPKHLTNGSLALGATPWQTFTRVVLLTASPGIFSGVMIGFGRAVGETMIVLMATGNTPVLDMSIFEGMRTLSANIAVEMPESEVGSTHYRVLFLAALVLFIFTFAFNTLAEIVRQRLRRKYSSL